MTRSRKCFRPRLSGSIHLAKSHPCPWFPLSCYPPCNVEHPRIENSDRDFLSYERTRKSCSVTSFLGSILSTLVDLREAGMFAPDPGSRFGTRLRIRPSSRLPSFPDNENPKSKRYPGYGQLRLS